MRRVEMWAVVPEYWKACGVYPQDMLFFDTRNEARANRLTDENVVKVTLTIKSEKGK